MSAHFTVDEFACHDGTPYPLEWVTTRLNLLVDALEELRTLYNNSPLVIGSGYRTEEYNRRIGGAKLSQHVQGRAADVRPVHPADVRLLGKLVEERLEVGGLAHVGGWGIYPGWIHLDVRVRGPNDHVAFWLGNGIGSETA